jgi:uncharacterized protein (TIGR04255 family)
MQVVCMSMKVGTVSVVNSEALRDVDQPLGGLSPGERVLLAKAQIELALGEVRFSGGRTVIGTDEALQVRDLLAAADITVPQLQQTQQQQVSVSVGPGGASPTLEVQTHGWQLASADGHLVVSLQPGTFAVQSTRYQRWGRSLAPALAATLSVVAEVMAPDLVHRVGLRYVNRLTLPGAVAPAAWRGSIIEAGLGLVTDDVLGPSVVATQQQVELRLGDTQGALIRHGAFVDAASHGEYSYLVDLDVFDAATARFDPAAILDVATRLNRTALPLFQHLVTPGYRERMEPYVEADSEGTTSAEGGPQ